MEHIVINDQVFQRLKASLGDRFAKRMVSRFQTETVNFVKQRFIEKNWINKNRRAWAPRKRRDRGSLMVKSGRLKRSIRKYANGAVGTDVPYAEIHNTGGRINKTVQVKAFTRKRTARATSERTGRKLKKRVASGTSQVKAHSRKINLKFPKRQFMGESQVLNSRLQRILSNEIEQQLNRL